MCETRIFMHTFNLNSISQMKRKIFSALLMGVFTLASMSMFVSCKDYDDDINNLDAEQQELLTRLQALEGEVNTNYTDLSGQLATAVENANKALQGSNDALAALEEVRTTASAAGTAAANAQTTADGAQEAAEEAQKTADEALQKAEDALKAIGVDESGVSLVEKVADLEKRLASLEALKETIPTLIEQAQKATNEQLKALNEQVAKYEAFFDNLFAMLTGVELYGTFTGNATDFKAGATTWQTLTMQWGKVVDNSKFGDNEAYTEANPLITFTGNDDIKTDQGIIVRVNPVNAQITGDNVSIKLMNSKGEDLSKYIEVAGVEPYDELITTRAGKINSGLYKIKFQIADGFDNDAFKAATTAKVSGVDKQILFAVAINNTDTLQEDRYVASTFDLTLTSEKYQNLSVLDYIVTGTNNDPMAVVDIHNRWNGKDATDDEGVAENGSGAKEYVWAESTKQNPTPASVATDDNTVVTGDANAYDPSFKDARCFIKKYVPVSFGVPFTVELTDAVAAKAAYYYVVLDKDFITDSDDSEQAAWFGDYSYVGLNKVTPADEKLSITVTAKNAKSDKIGFRVFAVNLDGTLIDPDGRAFYVSVGADASVESVEADIVVWKNNAKNNSTIVPLPANFKAVASALDADVTFGKAELEEGSDPVADDATITYALYKDAEGKEVASNWADAKYIGFTFNDANKFYDGGSFKFIIEDKSDEGNVDRIVNVLNVTVNKVMPTAADKKFDFKAGQLVNGVYTCYLDPDQLRGTEVAYHGYYDWTKTSTNGLKDLWNFVTGMDDEHFTWTFAAAQWDAAKKQDVAYTVQSKANGVLDIAIAPKYIDNSTQHATKIVYNFKDISYNYASDGVTLVSGDYPVAVKECQTVFACPLDPSVLTYSWNQKNIGTTTKPNMVNVNAIKYSETTPQYLAAGEKLTQYIKAVSAVDNARFTADGVWLDGLYCSVSATLTSDGTGNEDYYKVSYSGGDFHFTQVESSLTNPTTDVASTLTIKATDTFGHTKTIAELDFTVLRR